MREANRFVQKRSKQDIANLANLVREALQLGDERVAMAQLLEFVLPDLIEDYDFQVVDDAELAGAEGLTDLSRPVIRMSNTTYSELLEADPRARFTAAHELGHLLMHSNNHIHYARVDHVDRRSDPEWQANEFAAAFLMPEASFRQTQSIEEAMTRFGVGFRSAKWRAQSLRHRFRVGSKKKGYGMRRTP
jgi:Zn-dependent peptidase ImmA (M78 family)